LSECRGLGECLWSALTGRPLEPRGPAQPFRGESAQEKLDRIRVMWRNYNDLVEAGAPGHAVRQSRMELDKEMRYRSERQEHGVP
jgi:hypothetical protein